MSKNQPTSDQNEDTRGWTTERVGNDATMKDHSHKEYEARDKAPMSDPGPTTGQEPPAGVGDSQTRRGEDVHRQDGREFQQKGETPIGRPIGTSDPEKVGVAGEKPIDPDMPNVQHP
jgi:hypothetical protein